MATFFTWLLAFIKFFPAAKDAVEKFIAFYVDKQIDNMKEENRVAVKKAFAAHDQRELERLTNPGGAGVDSPIPGSEIVDVVPGVDDIQPPAGVREPGGG